MARIRKNNINTFKVKGKSNNAQILKPGEYVFRIDTVIYDSTNKKYQINYSLQNGTVYTGKYNMLDRYGEDNDFIIALLADIETQALDSAVDYEDVDPSILQACEGRYIIAEIINREFNGRVYDLFKPGRIWPASGFSALNTVIPATQSSIADEDE